MILSKKVRLIPSAEQEQKMWQSVGAARFKSRRKSKPSFYNDTFKLKVKSKSVLIEKMGWIKTNEQVPMDCKYTNPRVSFDGKYWYISIGIEIENPIVELTRESIGIVLALKNLLYVVME